MLLLSIFLFVLLTLFVLAGYYANKKQLPDLISELYYLGAKWRFSVVMIAVALGMLIAILDCQKGIQCLCFLGCGGLMFVGAAPNYLDKDNRIIHKVGAFVAGVGCVGWCLSACIIPTLAIGAAYILCAIYYRQKLWCIAELSAFLDTFITYWMVA